VAKTHVSRDGPYGAARDVADRVEGAHHDQHVRPEGQLVLVAAQAAFPQRLSGPLLLSASFQYACSCVIERHDQSCVPSSSNVEYSVTCSATVWWSAISCDAWHAHCQLSRC